jgi:hypothetical protein
MLINKPTNSLIIRPIKVQVILILDEVDIASFEYDYDMFLGDAITDLLLYRINVHTLITKVEWFRNYYGINGMYKTIHLILLENYMFDVDSFNRKGNFKKQEKDCFDILARRLSSLKYTSQKSACECNGKMRTKYTRTLKIYLSEMQYKRPLVSCVGKRPSYILTPQPPKQNAPDGNLIRLLAWNQQCNIKTYQQLYRIICDYTRANYYDEGIRFVLLYMWYYWGRSYMLLKFICEHNIEARSTHSCVDRVLTCNANNINHTFPSDIIYYIASLIKSTCFDVMLTARLHCDKEIEYVL